ncbi:MAG: patatin-like phospholipase family protein [Candidatus Competibacteraceae bacterium]
MLETQPLKDGIVRGGPRVGLALAGGGPLGIIYQIGALLALDEALEGVDLNDLYVYGGVSVGAINAAALANGFTPAKICHVFVRNDSTAFPLDPEHFMRPAFGLYWDCLKSVPGLLWDAIWGFIKNPQDRDILAILNKLGPALPPGLLDNGMIEEFLATMFSSRRRTNDFRRLKRKLFIVATDLDTGEIIEFGTKVNSHIPISKAVQASTAIPGLYPPVEIEGRYYVDGGVKKTVHASRALETGADLLICINPLVPFNAKLAKPGEMRKMESLVDGGLPVVMSQTFYALIHSRMKIGLAKYAADYPDRDIILFEPNSGDTKMFFSNVFSFANRRKVCEHAYQTTRRDLLARKNELIPLFARHGIGLRVDILEDRSRHFDSHMVVPPEMSKLAKLRNQLTNSLSDTLDDLEAWLEVVQQKLPATKSAEEVIELSRPEEEPISSRASKPVPPRAAAASAVGYLASSRH